MNTSFLWSPVWFVCWLLVQCGTTAASDWPQWRGPLRDNRSTEVNLLPVWPADGPPLVWRVDGLGNGIASVAIADGRIVTSTSYESNEYVVALDEATGQQLWARQVGPTVRESALMRWLSQRTPTVDGDLVFAFTNAGALYCLNARDGAVVWRKDYPTDFGTRTGRWGFCDRPLVDHETLICTPGGSQATVVALNKKDGRVLWKTLLESREQAAYGSTIALETDGLRQYVVSLDKGWASFAEQDGRFLWRYDGVSAGIGNTYTPLVVADGLLVPNGYRTGVARLKLTRQDRQVLAEEVYRKPIMLDAFEDSTVIVDERLYAFNQGNMPICVNVVDGSVLWGPVRPTLSGKSAATYADGHLYVRSTKGGISLVAASASEYLEKSRFTLPEPREAIGATFPVVTGGRLFVRDNDRLYCFDVSRTPTERPIPAPKFVTLTPPSNTSLTRAAVPRGPDAIFVPTPHDVVERMLAIAEVTKDDVVYDLGSGDGRIVIEAAKKYGCRAVGLEIKQDLVSLARKDATQAKVASLVTFKEADFFAADFGEASVVAAYLFPELLERLLPKLEQLKPGTRIVTHQFAIPGCQPEFDLGIDSKETGERHTVYLWKLPLRKQ